MAPRAWTRPTDVEVKVRRRWEDGSLLRAFAAGESFPVIDLPLRRPSVGEIGADLEAVRSWVAELETGATRRGRSRYDLVIGEVGGREVGRNRLPQRVRVSSYDQAWALLGVTGEVAAYQSILDLAAAEPTVHAWVAGHPLAALRSEGEWERLLTAYRWLDDSRGSGRYLREITAPGVDTKFVERHRGVLGRLLGASGSPSGFTRDLGLAAKPETVRLRFPGGTVRGLCSLTEATLRVSELAAAALEVSAAVIVENEVTFLSLPVPADGVLVWGKGFEVDRVGSLPWLRDTEVRYWGDLDTHGFAILDRLRAWLPQTRSFLMDRDTLLAHRNRWVSESSPTAARLDRLTPDEAALYADLVSDRFGETVRLEQERIDWAWVTTRLPYGPACG